MPSVRRIIRIIRKNEVVMPALISCIVCSANRSVVIICQLLRLKARRQKPDLKYLPIYLNTFAPSWLSLTWMTPDFWFRKVHFHQSNEGKAKFVAMVTVERQIISILTLSQRHRSASVVSFVLSVLTSEARCSWKCDAAGGGARGQSTSLHPMAASREHRHQVWLGHHRIPTKSQTPKRRRVEGEFLLL